MPEHDLGATVKVNRVDGCGRARTWALDLRRTVIALLGRNNAYTVRAIGPLVLGSPAMGLGLYPEPTGQGWSDV